jgi:hypothetical protein
MTNCEIATPRQVGARNDQRERLCKTLSSSVVARSVSNEAISDSHTVFARHHKCRSNLDTLTLSLRGTTVPKQSRWRGDGDCHSSLAMTRGSVVARHFLPSSLPGALVTKQSRLSHCLCQARQCRSNLGGEVLGLPHSLNFPP